MAAEAKAQVELKDFNSLFSLEGKVVVVTGGSRGLGLHAASGYGFLYKKTKANPLLIYSVCLLGFFKPAAPKYI